MPDDTSSCLVDSTTEKETKAAQILKDGCYLIRYTPKDPLPDVLFYEGTLRVMDVGNATSGRELKAGGDLYCRLREYPSGRGKWAKGAKANDPDKRVDPTLVPDPTQGIPIFPRRDYRYYLKVIKILEGVPAADNVTVRFQVYAFDRDSSWPNPGARTICTVRTMPPSSHKYPVPKGSTQPIYLTANVLDEDSGEIVGTLTMGWVSPNLRRATVVTDKLPGTESPGSKTEWNTAFKEAGFEIVVKERVCKVVGLAPNEDRWTLGDLHRAMVMAKRESADKKAITLNLSASITPELVDPDGLDLLDTEWRYHLFCVPLIEGFDRGVTFDTYGTDSSNVPREGSAVAGRWRFPIEKPPIWGELGNKAELLQQEKRAYFRVAVHEIGHDMGFNHNQGDNGFMNTSDAIAEEGWENHRKALAARITALDAQLKADTIAQAADATAIPSLSSIDLSTKSKLANIAARAKVLKQPAEERAKTLESEAAQLEEKKPFPANIKLDFHPSDLDRLRFGPDVTLRPGTTFDDSGPLYSDETQTRAEGLALQVSPLLDGIPLGAPARIHLQIRNISASEQEIPENLSLKSGIVSGRVVDRDGNSRTFWPLTRCSDSSASIRLAPNAGHSHALTLLRGAQGALFPKEDVYSVVVRITWGRNGSKVFVEAEAAVRVTAPIDEDHRAAALRVISTPDTLLSLAIGGPHLTEGNAAIDVAIKNPILRPHFAIVKAKQMADFYSISDACGVIQEDAVLSFAEIKRLIEMIGKAGDTAKHDTVRRTIQILQEKNKKIFLGGAVDPDSYNTLKWNLGKLLDRLNQP